MCGCAAFLASPRSTSDIHIRAKNDCHTLMPAPFVQRLLTTAVSYFDDSPASPLQIAAAATPYGKGHNNTHHGHDGARIRTHTGPRQKSQCVTAAIAIHPEVVQVPINGFLDQVHTKAASQITVTCCRIVHILMHSGHHMHKDLLLDSNSHLYKDVARDTNVDAPK